MRVSAFVGVLCLVAGCGGPGSAPNVEEPLGPYPALQDVRGCVFDIGPAASEGKNLAEVKKHVERFDTAVEALDKSTAPAGYAKYQAEIGAVKSAAKALQEALKGDDIAKIASAADATDRALGKIPIPMAVE